jgi:hypothetical protein
MTARHKHGLKHQQGETLDDKSRAVCEPPRSANVPQQDDGSSFFFQQQPVWRERGGVEVVEHLHRNGPVRRVLTQNCRNFGG